MSKKISVGFCEHSENRRQIVKGSPVVLRFPKPLKGLPVYVYGSKGRNEDKRFLSMVFWFFFVFFRRLVE